MNIDKMISEAKEVDIFAELTDTEKLWADKELMMQQALREKLNRLLWRFSMENGGDVKPWDGHTYHYYIYKPYDSNDPWTAWRVDGKDLGVVYFSSEDIVIRAMAEIVIPFMEKHPEFVW